MNFLAFAGLPGGPEVLVVLFVVLLLFGAKKLPELSRSLGRSLGEFKKGKEGLEREIRNVKDDLIPLATTEGKKEPQTVSAEPSKKEATKSANEPGEPDDS
ncbi:MAG: twin-arginine translocase TatA/TatE family subunit [Pontiella sp.]